MLVRFISPLGIDIATKDQMVLTYLTVLLVIQMKLLSYFSVCLQAYHSGGTVSSKHVQTAQTHNLQTKPPFAGTPGKTGNTTSSQQHIQHRENDFEKTWQSSFTTPWVSAHLHEQGITICFFGSHTDSMLARAHTHTLTAWLNANRNCRGALLL